ncbi:MAG: hypothetical protein P9M15_00555 [Candidatus Electryoneaceae bacterium]|nr:hypothetical protein [Candidatus Electryoneaceae bacterium]
MPGINGPQLMESRLLDIRDADKIARLKSEYRFTEELEIIWPDSDNGYFSQDKAIYENLNLFN